MAEERIVILTTNRKENSCHCVLEEGCHVEDSCALCNVGITRQEAIKKISSHLLMCDISTMDTDEIAEAALNVLLEK